MARTVCGLVLLLLTASAALDASPKLQCTTRQQALRSAALALALPSTARAYQGIYGMDIISAKDAVIDESALQSADVKAALKDLKSLYAAVQALRAKVASDAQFDVGAAIRADLDPTRVRSTFNALNPLFDKDTQKGTDRLQRGILQDLVEIDTSAKVAPGKARSPKKLALVNEKLEKLEMTFQKLNEYLATT